MLRPATPLAILLAIAFALLLLSVLSTPVIKAIPLGSFQGVTFGVFGFCNGGTCTSIQIGYDTCTYRSVSARTEFREALKLTLFPPR